MEVIKYLKQIYSGENALANHITLFSVCGIMVIFISLYMASLGNAVFPDFFISPPSSEIELFFEASLGVFIFIYLFGYCFKFVGVNFKQDNVTLPDMTLDNFMILIKSIPVMVVWALYYFVITFAGLYFLIKNDQIPLAYVFGAIMICLIPFFIMKVFSFSNNFKYSFELLNPFSLLSYLDRALGDVILLSLESLALIIVPILLLYLNFKYSVLVRSDSLKLGLRLGGLCLSTYLYLICTYIYSVGLVNILKKKFIVKD